jgi:hypothetical protein
MKVTRDQIKARAQELRNQKFTIKATLEMNAGARPVSNTPRHIPIDSADAVDVPEPSRNESEKTVLGKTA